jgi:AbrB family looped-hinge helix DNA binding protein
MEVMTTVTVSPKFQVVIPRDARKALGITPGQKIRVVALLDRLEFIPVKPAKALRGFIRGIDASVRREKDRV